MKKKFIITLILFLTFLLTSCKINNQTTEITDTQQTKVEYSRYDDLYNKLRIEGFSVLNGDIVIFNSNIDPFEISFGQDITYKYNKLTKTLTFTEIKVFSTTTFTDVYEFFLDKGIVKYTKSRTSNTENYTLSSQYNIITEELSSFTSNFPDIYHENETSNKGSIIQFILRFNNYFIKPISGYYLHEYYIQ